MTLKALATQLECQGVDPGYIQRFDWEKWILAKESDWSTGPLSFLVADRVKSLVLHLLQEYLKVVDEDLGKYAQELNAQLRKVEGELGEYKRIKGPLPTPGGLNP